MSIIPHNKPDVVNILCSGGFDPIHIGHVDYLEAAAHIGQVIVSLNSDAWLMAKKGYVFMPWGNRATILSALSCVAIVWHVKDDDGTICEALRWWKPDIFANGGDRIKSNPAEHAVCKELGIKEMFNVGGGKIDSSSDLVFDVLDKHPLNGP